MKNKSKSEKIEKAKNEREARNSTRVRDDSEAALRKEKREGEGYGEKACAKD